MAIADMWADRIISGDKTYKDVPPKLKDAVAESLKNKGKPEFIIK